MSGGAAARPTVEAVTGGRAARFDEPGVLDVAQHPRGPARRCRRLVNSQPVGSHIPNPTMNVRRLSRGFLPCGRLTCSRP